MYIKVMQQNANIIEVDKYITIMFCGLGFNRNEFFPQQSKACQRRGSNNFKSVDLKIQTLGPDL